jgi:formylglycine-generating enzyme required for sulfatase activity
MKGRLQRNHGGLRHWCRPLGMGLIVLLGSTLAAAGGGRALVIGNAKYERERPLANTVHDAEDVAAKLRGLGFEVVPLTNLPGREMRREVSRFLESIRGVKDMAILYYSGHGIQDSHRAGYLLPVDARIEGEADVKSEGISVNTILEELAGRPDDAVSLVVLDACRDNPYAASRGGKGLGRVTANGGTLVLYAASPNQTADDNPQGRNGRFTEHLLGVLDRPGLDIEDAFDEVALAVKAASGGAQLPYKEGNLLGKHYLAGPAAGAVVAPAIAPAVAPAPGPVVPSPAPAPKVPEPAMVRLPGGCFEMGSPATEKGREKDERLHRVCVEAFSLGVQEVTVGEFRRFVTATGYRSDAERDAGGFDGCRTYDRDDAKDPWSQRDWADWRTPNRYQENQEEHPVSCVSWNDAAAYIEWLKREIGGDWRLPTEAEWEYAARAGTKTMRYWGDGDAEACDYENLADRDQGWDSGFPCDDGEEWVAPVGQFQGNAWELKDMLGNVSEWTCSDYAKSYGGTERQCDESGDGKTPRAWRGSGWGDGLKQARCAYRGSYFPARRHSSLGFRLARTLSP